MLSQMKWSPWRSRVCSAPRRRRPSGVTIQFMSLNTRRLRRAALRPGHVETRVGVTTLWCRTLWCGRQELHGDADQLGQVAHVELLLELGRDIDHRLVAHGKLLGDAAVGLAF